jgi:hypothetical protein
MSTVGIVAQLRDLRVHDCRRRISGICSTKGLSCVWFVCLMLSYDPSSVAAGEMDVFSDPRVDSRIDYLFNGQELRGWKQTDDGWKIADSILRYHQANTEHISDNSLHYETPIARDCEIGFVWRESGKTENKKRLNPSFVFAYNLGVLGSKDQPSYGTSIDYQVSGIGLRIHSRSVNDTSPVNRRFDSGFFITSPAKDVSKPVGEWNRSRIVCSGSRVQFWLNEIQTFDIDLEREKNRTDHNALADVAIDDWIETRKNGVYLSIIAPRSKDAAMADIRIRFVAVRAPGALDRSQPGAATHLNLGKEIEQLKANNNDVQRDMTPHPTLESHHQEQPILPGPRRNVPRNR